MCESMVDIQSAAAEIRRGIKKEERKKSHIGLMSASATQGGRNKQTPLKTSTALRYTTQIGEESESYYVSKFIYLMLQ